MAQALGLLYTATLEVVPIYGGPSFRILPVGLPSPRPALFRRGARAVRPSARALGACRSTVSAPRLV